MNARVRNLIPVALGAGALGLAGALTWTGRAMAQGPPPHPHPLQVEVVNTPTVNVGNPTSNPVLTRDVDNPARQPFSAFLQCAFVIPEQDCADFADAVPTGKLLVVETITVHARNPVGQLLTANVLKGGNGVHFYGYLDLSLVGTSGPNTVFRTVANLRSYYEAGTVPGLEVESLSPNASGAMDATLSGYFVDCGSGTGCPIP